MNAPLTVSQPQQAVGSCLCPHLSSDVTPPIASESWGECGKGRVGRALSSGPGIAWTLLNWCFFTSMREILMGCLLRVCPVWGPNPPPGRVPQLGIELNTLYFAERCPTN